MITHQLDKVVDFYKLKGIIVNTEAVENCFSTTAIVYDISPEEVYSIISPYFYETTTSSSTNNTRNTNKTNDKSESSQQQDITDKPLKIVLSAKASTQTSFDFTNIDEDYDIHVDDQTGSIVPYSEQEFLKKDFRSKVVYRFPRFDKYSYLPPKFGKSTYFAIQKQIREELPKLENVNWTNQTLSYARSNIVGKHIIECIIYPLFIKGLFGRTLKVVDATGNVGADSISFAMETFVECVKVYEILPNVYNMLVKNVSLYGMNRKIQSYNKRFDYDVPKNSLVIIDPPYEADNNKGNFNLSIDSMPIYCVAEKVLNAGAACVMLSMPKTYKYNTKFAIDHRQHVSVYQMGKINNKMFLITRDRDAERVGLIDFNYTLVKTDETQKTWNGKVDVYKCKSSSIYELDEKGQKYKLTLPDDL